MTIKITTTISLFSLMRLLWLAEYVSSFVQPHFGQGGTCLTTCFEKTSWLNDAMEGFNKKEEDDTNVEGRLGRILPLAKGLAGFVIDPNRGFCAILASNSKFVPVVVAPADTVQVSSPEASTMVQLAGGLDLGTAILPPDSLVKLVAEELETEGQVADLRPRISLGRVQANYNKNAIPLEGIEDDTQLRPTSIESTPERDRSIQEAMPKVLLAVKGLAGLGDVSEEQVARSMQLHANEQGQLDRPAFSNVLETIRRELSPPEQSQVVFVLTANILSGDKITQVNVETTNPVQALGLAFRYKINVIEVEEGLLQYPEETVLELFPAFRPISELNEDAKIMDGFIPSMYGKAQEIDNDMKE